MAAVPPNSPASKAFFANLMKQSDMVPAIILLLSIAMLIVPLPEFVLDTMLVLNFMGATLVMLIALYSTEPLQFSIFPSLLLIMTLFRLSLNVAATKLILRDGHAGAVIEAFGKYVIGGNYIVGIIAFLIVVVVNFVVITNGAGRVAEVSARFTLDAMPGKQMAIDAEMNAGQITEQQAKERRKKIEGEADFHGAMDGSSKFVRGDAMAAILIIIINIVGGFAMGMSHGGNIMDVVQKYTLLTIGEGLVGQIPALLISTATGLIVTRSASGDSTGQEFVQQLFLKPRPLIIVTGLLMVMFVLPGFPKLQILVVAGCLGATAWFLTQREKADALRQKVEEDRAASQVSDAPEEPESVLEYLGVMTIELELGSNLIALAVREEGGDLAERIGSVRKQIALELGIILPTVRLRDNLQLRANQYQIKIKGAAVASHELYPNCVLALEGGIVYQRFEGIDTIEPAMGTPAQWIARSLKERAEMAGYIIVDPATVLITHLTEVIKSHASELLTRQETQKLIDHVKNTDAAAVEELLPNLMTLGEVQKVLQSLLSERVGVRDLATILETLADYSPRTKDSDALCEFSRQALARQICKQYQEDDGVIRVLTLAPGLEQEMRGAVQATPTGNMLAIEPQMAQSLIRSLSQQMEAAADQGYNPVLLCSGQIRLPVKRLIERSLPTLAVIAYTEIVPKVEVEAVGTVEAELSLVPA